VLAGSGLDVLGLAAVELDGLGLDGLELAGGVDGPRVAPGGVVGLGSGVGPGANGLGWDVGLAHAPELWPVTVAGARPGLDGLAVELAGDALVVLELTDGDGLLGLGLDGDGLAGLGLAGGVAAAGVEDAHAAACPGFWVPGAAAAPVPAGGPPPGPPAPGPPAPCAPALVPAGAPPMAWRSALACDSSCCPNGVTAETLIAMMSVTAATTAARRARPSRGRCAAAGCATP
jgi:hypothetical protein